MLHTINTNLKTCTLEKSPEIDCTAYIHPLASVIDNVRLGKNVVVASAASVCGNEAHPIWVGDDVNIQENVIIQATATCVESMQGCEAEYEIHIGDRVSLASKSQVYGPAKIGSDTFIGTQALVFKANIGSNCVIEPKAAVMEVSIPDGRYVPAGSVITNQIDADYLPLIDDVYRLKDLNKAVVHVNVQMAKDYSKKGTMTPSHNHPCVKVGYCLSY